MRLLFVTHKYPPQKGGVAVSCARITEGMARRCERLDVLYATREEAPGAVRARTQGDLTVFALGQSERAAESCQLMEAAIRSLDEVHDYSAVVGFYGVPTGYVAVFTARLLGKPSLLCLRGNDLDRGLYHDGQSAGLRWALEQATRVVGVSRELQRKAQLLSGRDDIDFVANSVDSEAFAPLAVEARPRSLLFAGEMRVKKGSGPLLEALTRLSGDWRCTLAGGFRGEAEREFRRWTLQHPEAAARVKTVPYVRDLEHLRRLYAEAELVVNPALWDGMPNSVLEAMACARPVLTTQVGGIVDLVEHGRTGYLIGLSQLDELAKEIEAVWADPNRFEIGRRARSEVQERFTPERELAEFHRLLAEISASRVCHALTN